MNLNPDSPLLYDIKKMVEKKAPAQIDMLLEVVNLLTYNDARSSDLLEIYKLLDLDTFVKLVSLIDGRTVKLPSREELEENLITAILYYDRSMLGLSWKDIKKKYPELDISSIKYALKHKKLNQFVDQHIQRLYKDIQEGVRGDG